MDICQHKKKKTLCPKCHIDRLEVENKILLDALNDIIEVAITIRLAKEYARKALKEIKNEA